MASTYGTHALTADATLLDLSTGADLLAPVASIRTRRRSGVTTSVGAAPLDAGGFAEAERQRSHAPRVVDLSLDDCHGDQFDALQSALGACRGGAGFVEWRHPDDDHEDPTLWRFDDGGGLPARRDALHHASLTITLEEV